MISGLYFSLTNANNWPPMVWHTTAANTLPETAFLMARPLVEGMMYDQFMDRREVFDLSTKAGKDRWWEANKHKYWNKLMRVHRRGRQRKDNGHILKPTLQRPRHLPAKIAGIGRSRRWLN